MNQYGYSNVLPSSIITSHQDVMVDNQQWNCGGGINGSTNLSPYQTEFCASNYSIMQRQQYGAKIGPGSSAKSIKEARIRRPMNGEEISSHFDAPILTFQQMTPSFLQPSWCGQKWNVKNWRMKILTYIMPISAKCWVSFN
jgi:hypothetical protein